MPLVEQHVIARTNRRDRPIDAAAFASRRLWNAANSLLAEVTSLVSRWGVRRSGPRSAKRTTETRCPGSGGSRCSWLSATWSKKDQPEYAILDAAAFASKNVYNQ